MIKTSSTAHRQNKKHKKLISMQRHWFNGLVTNHPKFWTRLGNFESKVLEFDLEPLKVNSPIYVSGLARSGSTILLEFLADHKDFVSHKYSDFPFIYTPYLWRVMQKLLFMKAGRPEERFHGDGLLVNADSPEAMEEVLWMHFFPFLHDTEQCQVLNAEATQPAFEKFYTDHIKKLLLQSKRPRYLAKDNYNIARIDYLSKVCPSAKFFIPVRNPITHVESLYRQHKHFSTMTGNDKRAQKHLQRVGHFEFGHDVRPIHLYDDPTYKSISDLFKQGHILRGYARYWSYIYNFIYDRYINADNVFIYRFEDFCEESEEMLKMIADFAEISTPARTRKMWADYIKAPAYYQTTLNAEERDIIEEETETSAKLWGY